MNDELSSLIEQEKNAIKNEENISIDFSSKNEKAIEEKKSNNLHLIDEGINAAVVHKIKTDETVQAQMLDTADKLIGNKLEQAHNDSEREKKEAVFKNNKDACDLYGIDEKTVPTWVVRGAKMAHSFWYVVWLIVGFFTTAPIVFLAKKITVILKRTWVAVLFAILIYAAVIFTPILINYIK